jgi:hypothetical protein
LKEITCRLDRGLGGVALAVPSSRGNRQQAGV